MLSLRSVACITVNRITSTRELVKNENIQFIRLFIKNLELYFFKRVMKNDESEFLN